MTQAAAARLPAGFAAPVPDAQTSFRALMQALAFPGRVAHMAALQETPAGWPPALAAAALTLFDAETPVWLDPEARAPDAEAFIRFHAGAPIVDRAGAAQFAVVLDPATAPYDDFAIGVDQYPDRSATALIALPALAGGGPMRLAGPGIETTRDIAPAGDLALFWRIWARNRALYPLGIDAFFCAGDAVLGLPRGVSATALQE